MLDDILRAAEAGRFPSVDGGLTVAPQPVPAGDLSAPLNPPVGAEALLVR